MLKNSSPDVDKSNVLINDVIESIGCDMMWQLLKLGNEKNHMKKYSLNFNH